MKLIKVSDLEEKYVNPEFVNSVARLNNLSGMYCEISTSYIRIWTELSVEEVIGRLTNEKYP